MVLAELLTTWFMRSCFAPRLESLEIEVTFWDSNSIATAGPYFERLDQQTADRTGTLRRIFIRNAFFPSVPEKKGLGWAEAKEVLSSYMWRSRESGILQFTS